MRKSLITAVVAASLFTLAACGNDDDTNTAASHNMSGMDHGDMSSDDMGGMMTENEMADLESASGAEFDQMFLTMMIEHHEGAIEMAKTEQSEGEFPEAVDMAKEIETTQAEEIQTMQDLLKS